MTNLTKLSNLFLVFWLLFIHSTLTFAADLTFTPNAPIVEQGKQITLLVSGTSGEVTWTVAKGQIQGTGTQVTYVAPALVGLDVVTVMDGGGNVATVKIVVTPLSETQSLQMENANWEIFTNRREIHALLLSEDEKTLWVGTQGGLEKRDAQTGEIQQVFINTDGLPSNNVTALISDGEGGLWVGTGSPRARSNIGGGLAHYSAKGQWQIFNKDNSGLSDNDVTALLSDSQGGLWVGTYKGGVAHYTAQKQWQVFKPDNSGLPSNGGVMALLSDSQGGLWIGTVCEYDISQQCVRKDGGLAHYSAQGQWQVFTEDNSDLPSNEVIALLSDSQGGLWVGTNSGGWVGIYNGGVAHYTAQKQWQVFKPDNSGLPSDWVYALLSDGQGGLWVGTGSGLAHRGALGEWTGFTTDSGLPSNLVSALLGDGQGGLWMGTPKGLAHHSAQGKMTGFTIDWGLPSNRVTALLSDGQGGQWVGTWGDGLAHRSAQGEWTAGFTTDSGLSNSYVRTLLSDGQGGLWAGIWEGLAHRSAEGELTVFTTDSGLPAGDVGVDVSALLSDGQGGLWVGTWGHGLAHRHAQGKVTVFTTDSGLPGNWVSDLLSDGQGGLWVGTHGGLAHGSAQGEVTVFTTDSGLSNEWVSALLSDGQGGLWAGIGGGLAHRDAQGKVAMFTTLTGVTALFSDGQGGLWVGTSAAGLAHYSAQGELTWFNTKNSGLPRNESGVLLSDSQGGLWIGADYGGLAHLTFTQKTALCQTTDATTCENLQATKRAAILIAGGGADNSNTLWDTTESITNYLYKVFNKRGFDNDEIYYLSPKSWADFNGDGLDDRIVDAPKPERPLTPEDVRLALEWAKGLGKLDQPLYLFFVDHGGTEKFQLSKLEYLEVTTLKTWLDDYQTVTGNQVMMVIDACHSGQLLDSLKAPNRAIVSSTSDGLAYFDRTDKRGFSRFFAAGLLKGMNFWEAFGYAGGEQTKLLGDMSKLATASTGAGSEIGQVPRFDDGSDEGQWLKQIYLNGSFAAGDLTLAVESLTTSTTLSAGSSLPLKAKAVLAAGLIERVWAVLRPPKMNLVMDSNGTPILVLPRLTLSTSSSEKDVWEATWQEAIYNGNYQVTFYAEDNQGNIASSDLPVVITVTGGIEPPPQAMVQLGLEKTQYQFGERFTATLTEQLSWGYDLYAAVLLPDGQTFVTLKNLNEFAPLNEPKPWRTQRVQTRPVTWIDMTLPDTLPKGQYCLFGILSPEGGEVFETLNQGLWVMDSKCFEIF